LGEHRVDQLAARKRPVPRPLTEPIEVLIPHPSGEPAHRRLRRHRWRRRITRALRSKRGRWVLVTFACIAVLIIGLLAQGFLSSPAPAVSVPNAGGTGISTPPPNPSPSASNGKHHKGDGNKLVNNPVQRLRNVLPDNPLNHLHGAATHQVILTVRSAGSVPILGYLVPTGLRSAYGTVKHPPSHWSLQEQAVGPGYLAAVFIQAGPLGIPVTCTVTVDGKVTNSETTSGQYGGAVCLG
jgi:hypothetical protein